MAFSRYFAARNTIVWTDVLFFLTSLCSLINIFYDRAKYNRIAGDISPSGIPHTNNVYPGEPNETKIPLSI